MVEADLACALLNEICSTNQWFWLFVEKQNKTNTIFKKLIKRKEYTYIYIYSYFKGFSLILNQIKLTPHFGLN